MSHENLICSAQLGTAYIYNKTIPRLARNGYKSKRPDEIPSGHQPTTRLRRSLTTSAHPSPRSTTWLSRAHSTSWKPHSPTCAYSSPSPPRQQRSSTPSRRTAGCSTSSATPGGPIDEIPGHFVEVELPRVNDAQLKRVLPCPVYRVISSEPFLDAAGQPSQPPRPSGGMCVEDMQLIGSYVSAATAKARANEVLAARMSDHPVALPKHVTAVHEGQDAMGVIIPFSGNSTPVVSFIVMVSYDSGIMLDLEENEM
ncbi:hypothetical protein FJTKL_06855 [Diaporthe vaccinii]|uniref:Uncharacterized protein n=1 Tax=Diaporthe vaccinii TaxID=105482 RepID=A0ABR4EVL2_9PEZI